MNADLKQIQDIARRFEDRGFLGDLIGFLVKMASKRETLDFNLARFDMVVCSE
jgi:hypothetical protein